MSVNGVQNASTGTDSDVEILSTKESEPRENDKISSQKAALRFMMDSEDDDYSLEYTHRFLFPFLSDADNHNSSKLFLQFVLLIHRMIPWTIWMRTRVVNCC